MVSRDRQCATVELDETEQDARLELYRSIPDHRGKVDSPHPEVPCGRELSAVEVERGETHQCEAEQRRVSGFLRELVCTPVGGFDLRCCETSMDDHRAPERDLQGELALDAIGAVRQQCEQLEASREVRDRLTMGSAAERILGRRVEVRDRTRGIASALEVDRELGSDLADAGSVRRLVPDADAVMDGRALRGGQALVRHVLEERVDE